MKRIQRSTLLVVLIATTIATGCSTVETKRVLETEKVVSYRTDYSGEKSVLVVGNFNNQSNYMQGLFSDGKDRLGNQAKTILKTHLQQTNRFRIVDRENMQNLKEESEISNQAQSLVGARYAIGGGISEFGRKEVGDKQLFGLIGSGKKQIAYTKVLLNIIDVSTSEIIYSTQGAAEYELAEREVLGFGTDAGYDATLNGKVLNLAITEAVNNMVRELESGYLNLSN